MAAKVESGIEFTYTPPVSFTKFDVPGSNTAWKGVDFIIDEGGRWLWLEVKNFRYGRHRNKSLSEARRNQLHHDLFEKFLGTTSYLAHSGSFVSKPLFFAVLLEVPEQDAALKGATGDLLRQYVRPWGPWKSQIEVGVFDLAKWNERFPEYSAQRV